jgi:hypothetical protein
MLFLLSFFSTEKEVFAYEMRKLGHRFGLLHLDSSNYVMPCQESILPNFAFPHYLIFAIKLECLLHMEKIQ